MKLTIWYLGNCWIEWDSFIARALAGWGTLDPLASRKSTEWLSRATEQLLLTCR